MLFCFIFCEWVVVWIWDYIRFDNKKSTKAVRKKIVSKMKSDLGHQTSRGLKQMYDGE